MSLGVAIGPGYRLQLLSDMLSLTDPPLNLKRYTPNPKAKKQNDIAQVAAENGHHAVPGAYMHVSIRTSRAMRP